MQQKKKPRTIVDCPNCRGHMTRRRGRQSRKWLWECLACAIRVPEANR